MNLEAPELEINHLRAEGVPWSFGVVWPVNEVAPILVMPRHVLEAVSKQASITLVGLLGRRRDAKAAQARQIAMLVMRETQPNMSLTEIARIFDRDHTTVLTGIRAARDRLKSLKRWRRFYTSICKTLDVPPKALESVIPECSPRVSP